MAETRQLQLPLLAAAQAQKHVTVNEALARLDALARLTVESVSLAAPPSDAVDGTCYVVPVSATGVWAGRTAEIAIRSNGGWTFAVPVAGLRAWLAAGGRDLIFDGSEWVEAAIRVTPGGAATLAQVVEFDHVIGAGASSTTFAAIPSHAQVLAVTARVIAAISGAGVSSLSLGVAADPARYGSGLGLGLNSYTKGVTGSPLTYYDDTALILTPDAGTFAGGVLRIAIHLLEVLPPRPV